MPEEFVVLQVERVELSVLAFALHFEAVEELGLLAEARVVDVLLDHAEVLFARRDGLDLAVESVVVDVDRVGNQALRLRVFLDLALDSVFFLEVLDHIAERADKVRLLLDLLERVDRMVGHLAEAEVVWDEGVEFAAQSKDLGLVIRAERLAAVVFSANTLEKDFYLGKIFVALLDGLIRKLTER